MLYNKDRRVIPSVFVVIGEGMDSYNGISVSEGIFFGEVYAVWQNRKSADSVFLSADVESELKRFSEALKTVREDFLSAKTALMEEGKEEDAALFSAYCTIIDDPSFASDIVRPITEKGINAESALKVYKSLKCDASKEETNESINRYLRDIVSIIDYLYAGLTFSSDPFSYMPENLICVTQDISAIDIMSARKRNVGAIVVSEGSKNSHASILARDFGIPMIIVPDILGRNFNNKERMIVDANKGLVFIDPDEFTVNRYEASLKRSVYDNEDNCEPKKESSNKVKLYANISSSDDVVNCISSNADGIGLFRTEFLFIGKEYLPSVPKQMEEYSKVCESMQGKPVIIRTIDMGSDKDFPAFSGLTEKNPALGLRGIRYCFEHIDLFCDQLSALLQCASKYDNLKISFPMISSVDEVYRIKQIIEKLSNSLEREGKSFRIPPLGVMIETPAAVMISRELAKEVDFFCIGTNDLTQYTLAVSRESSVMAKYYDSKNPAILRLIEIAIENAKSEGIPVGMCGELASDAEMTEKLIKMGIDSLSVAPSVVLKLRISAK